MVIPFLSQVSRKLPVTHLSATDSCESKTAEASIRFMWTEYLRSRADFISNILQHERSRLRQNGDSA